MNADPAIDEVILNSDLRHTHFFNGRLLTGGDLEAEQNAQAAQARLLGEAMGEGIAYGFEVKAVTSSPPEEQLVSVTAGLAVNRAGQTVRLACDQRVALLRQPDPAKRDACVFADCSAPIVSGTLARGVGFYLLTATPASQPEGRAQVSGLGSGAAACNSRYLTEGVKFRLLPLDVTDSSTVELTRNDIAHRFFDLTTNQAARFLDALQAGTSDARGGWADLVTGHQLSDCDVPLAVIEWRANHTLGFIDAWPVRRRMTRTSPSPWPFALDDQARSEAEARFLQFQDHLEAVRGSAANPSLVEARQFFRRLPPAGLVPLAGAAAGFDRTRFFAGMTVRDPLYVEGARVRHLLQLALDYPPIDVQGAQMVWLYIVRENAQAGTGSMETPPPVSLLFASGQLPYVAVPQFNVSHWSYGNYVLS